ncbi:hypothetical protein [uncultured Phenylobacterium sp.]|uniref:hypothetical protein n=1 Tax=uncultured Phenylobacterium sp. TaxID=349273 RepID=UPI0025EE4497|nr:hypothetical protein [uncultured Phenylobacterium sp.]
MSFTENDRKLQPESGRSFPPSREATPFNESIASALKADFGSARSVVKHVARLTGANDRTVRNWFEGNNGPSGENLVSLMRHSDAVMDVVLLLSRRGRSARGVALLTLRDKLSDAVAAIDAIEAASRDLEG